MRGYVRERERAHGLSKKNTQKKICRPTSPRARARHSTCRRDRIHEWKRVNAVIEAIADNCKGSQRRLIKVDMNALLRERCGEREVLRRVPSGGRRAVATGAY